MSNNHQDDEYHIRSPSYRVPIKRECTKHGAHIEFVDPQTTSREKDTTDIVQIEPERFSYH